LGLPLAEPVARCGGAVGRHWRSQWHTTAGPLWHTTAGTLWSSGAVFESVALSWALRWRASCFWIDGCDVVSRRKSICAFGWCAPFGLVLGGSDIGGRRICVVRSIGYFHHESAKVRKNGRTEDIHEGRQEHEVGYPRDRAGHGENGNRTRYYRDARVGFCRRADFNPLERNEFRFTKSQA
jgi:hypothetical protein